MTLPGIATLLHLKETASTQTLARTLADGGAEDRTLVWADRQTRGRGRMSRKWDSAEGGLYFSLILKPDFPPSLLARFSLMTAHSVAVALAKHAAIETTIKPPNDILASRPGGQPKKICGILSEASGNSRGLDWLVVGIGININNQPGIKSAVSLKNITKRTWDIPPLLRTVLTQFNSDYRKLY